jgi:hypothetical protein
MRTIHTDGMCRPLPHDNDSLWRVDTVQTTMHGGGREGHLPGSSYALAAGCTSWVQKAQREAAFGMVLRQ